MGDKLIRGKAWKGGDNIFAFDIIPQRRWSVLNLDAGELGKWAMEDVAPEFREVENAFKNAGYTVIVAGANFGGGGKSIEHPIFALMGAGIKAVLAESFSRYNLRNSINNGLPALVCKGITGLVEMGDELELNLATGEVKNLTNGKRTECERLPDFVLEIISAGGYLAYTRNRLTGGEGE
jgi:3-isopropylmalate/(R)-2-methylmalate dehydratase small subunit